ncbi:ribose 5-phosphate isomerase B [soil metagenome]
MSERIPIAADHAGFELKRKLVETMRELGYEPQDMGAYSPEPSDYPDLAHPVAKAVAEGQAQRGVLLCGSGIGMDIVANRYPGVRAALVWDPQIAEMSRKHNDANVLVLPARFISESTGVEILKRWLTTGFEGGRHERRVTKIEPPPPSAGATGADS